ncbi:hypothetical protein [Rhizobacter sp. P5_C2]
MRFLPILLLLVISASTRASPPEGDQQIAAFVLPPERLERRYRTVVYPSLLKLNPALADELKNVADSFNGREVSNRLATLLITTLSDAERASIRAFMNSKSGRQFAKIQRESDDAPAVLKKMQQLPVTQQQEIVAFASSVAGEKVLRVLTSPEATALNQSYGAEILCAQLARTKPEQYEALRQDGRCPTIQGQ